MTKQQILSRTASCHCGQVELTATGEPIAINICYCDDCQAGALQIETLPMSHPVRNSDGGVSYMLYRKDRISCSKGAPLLRTLKIREKSATNRVVASCCNSAMFMNFDDGRFWVCAYRDRFQGDLPPVQMRICTKFMPQRASLPSDIPSYSGYPVRFMAKLVAAWVPMLLRR
jgi:hypothetical protein